MEFLKVIRGISAGILILVFSQIPALAQEAPEYQIKAAMLYKFALFVEWPAGVFSSPQSPFAVCVLGKDPFGPWLYHEMGGTRIGTHPVVIRFPGNARDAGACQIVFISRSEQPRIKDVLAALKNTHALLVSDIRPVDEFCLGGGMIGLIIKNKKVRFELNAALAEKKGFRINSTMKRVATSVKCGEGP